MFFFLERVKIGCWKKSGVLGKENIVASYSSSRNAHEEKQNNRMQINR